MVGYFTAILILTFLSSNIREKTNKLNVITIQQLVRIHVGPLSEKVTAIPVLILSIAGTAMNLFVIGRLYGTILDIPHWVLILLISAVIGIYLAIGGYGMVMKTDLAQIIVIGLVLIIPFIIPFPNEKALDFSSLLSLNFPNTAGLFFLAFLFAFSDGSVWQKIFASKNCTVVHVAFPLGVFISFLVTLPVLWIAFAIQPYLTTNTQSTNFIEAFLNIEDFSTTSKTLYSFAILAMSASTIDTLIYTFCSTFIINFLPSQEAFPSQASITIYKKRFKVVMAMMFGITIILAATMNDILSFLFNSLSIFYIVAPVFLFAAMGWISKSRLADVCITFGICSSAIIYIVLSMNGMFSNMLYISLPALVSLGFCLFAALVKYPYRSKYKFSS
jgi:Na+/proline symporter